MARVFLQISIDGSEPKKITIQLYKEQPKTSENFRALCTGEKGIGQAGDALHFKGNKFHRIIKGFMAQAGDITAGNGTGGESIYGSKFQDENMDIKHTSRGILSMANGGPNTNNSQFFICFVGTPHLNGKHTVFGEIIEGLEVLEAIEQVGTGNGKPLAEVVIADCGQE